jgi:hypothetical protein
MGAATPMDHGILGKTSCTRGTFILAQGLMGFTWCHSPLYVGSISPDPTKGMTWRGLSGLLNFIKDNCACPITPVLTALQSLVATHTQPHLTSLSGQQQALLEGWVFSSPVYT